MTKAESYRWAAKRVRAQVERHQDLVATLANTAAILKEYRANFFWVGFYFFRQDHLLLGPFQGPPACVRLDMSKGVCAHAASTRQTIVVANVHEFPGHVACDSRSNSEIVVPLFDSQGTLQAVLDVDSEQLNDFDDEDRHGLQEIAKWLQPVWSLTIK